MLGCVGIRKDGIHVKSLNGSADKRTPEIHAECRLARKLTPDSVIYVARINASGEMAMARPCPDCERVLRNKGVRKVYYSINDFEYGVLKF